MPDPSGVLKSHREVSEQPTETRPALIHGLKRMNQDTDKAKTRNRLVWLKEPLDSYWPPAAPFLSGQSSGYGVVLLQHELLLRESERCPGDGLLPPCSFILIFTSNFLTVTQMLFLNNVIFTFRRVKRLIFLHSPLTGELPSNARQLFLHLNAPVLRTCREEEACTREEECGVSSRDPGLAVRRKDEDFMKVRQSAVAILSTTGGLNNPGKYYILCVKGIGVVFLPAVKKWPELSQDVLCCDTCAPEIGRVEVAVVLWGKGKTTKIKTLPFFLVTLCTS